MMEDSYGNVLNPGDVVMSTDKWGDRAHLKPWVVYRMTAKSIRLVGLFWVNKRAKKHKLKTVTVDDITLDWMKQEHVDYSEETIRAPTAVVKVDQLEDIDFTQKVKC